MKIAEVNGWRLDIPDGKGKAGSAKPKTKTIVVGNDYYNLKQFVFIVDYDYSRREAIRKATEYANSIKHPSLFNWDEHWKAKVKASIEKKFNKLNKPTKYEGLG